jgi:hypothetical protein
MAKHQSGNAAWKASRALTEALLTILRDEAASAAAKASAARTLLEYFSEQRPLGEQSADTLSEDELDAEIARLKA